MKTIIRIQKLSLAALLLLFLGFERDEEWKAPREADELVNPYAKNIQATQLGELVFFQHCVVCHGEKAKGNGPVTSSLETRPKNLLLDNSQENSDGALFWKITTGRSPMPSFKTILSDEQRWQLVNFIRELRVRYYIPIKK